MPKRMTDREYRSLRLEAREQQDDEEGYIAEGYATTFDQPYLLYKEGRYTVMEQVASGAFAECDMTDVIMQYDHEGRVFARTRNKTLDLTVDKQGLAMRARLGGTEGGRSLYEEIKGGYIDRMSFAFHVAEDERTYTEDHETGTYTVLRTIKRIDKLYDVSAVSIPANDATSISARSVCDGLIAEAKAEAERAREQRRLAIKLRLI